MAVWLARHELMAQGEALLSGGDDIAEVDRMAQGQGADCQGADWVLAGAHGDIRLREWAPGGVTQDMLLHGQRCCFVSH